MLANSLRLLASQSGSAPQQVAELRRRFPSIPDEYLKLVVEATEIEVAHENGQYFRIWGPRGCIEMDEGYNISKRIAGAIPIGDDGGGNALFYMKSNDGFGLYRVGYGNFDAEDAIFVAHSLSALLEEAVGIERVW